MGKCLFLRKGETHTAPISGILASGLAVGSSVYLMENGTAAEYLVVNQGIPSNSNLYDSSCNGTWLLRKNLYTSLYCNGNTGGNYLDSYLHRYLNSTFLGLFDTTTKVAINNVKLPYIATPGDRTVTSGASGMGAKVFSLSYREVGFSYSQYNPNDGLPLSYFTGDSTRIATLNETATSYWLRSYSVATTGQCGIVKENGGYTSVAITQTHGIRPALILPSNALFDKNTLILKGVA